MMELGLIDRVFLELDLNIEIIFLVNFSILVELIEFVRVTKSTAYFRSIC